MKQKSVIQKVILILAVIIVIGSTSPVASARADDRFVSYSATLKTTGNGDL